MLLMRTAVRALPRCALGVHRHDSRVQGLTRVRFGCHNVSSLPLTGAVIRCQPVSSTAQRCSEEEGDSVAAPDQSILLYKLKSKRLVRIASAASVISGIYWTSYLSFVGSVQGTPGLDSSEPWGMLGIVSAAALMGSSYIFADKLVGTVIYRPESHSLSISTHSFSTREKDPRNIPIGRTELGSHSGRAVYLPFKVKGDRGYCLLDLNDGAFYNRDLLLRLLAGNINVDSALKLSRGEELEGDDTLDGAPLKFKFQYGKKSKGYKKDRYRR